jgi:hypothetical protein
LKICKILKFYLPVILSQGFDLQSKEINLRKWDPGTGRVHVEHRRREFTRFWYYRITAVSRLREPSVHNELENSELYKASLQKKM